MKPKVLILTDSLSPVGGKEILAARLAVLLKRSGRYEPIVFSTRDGGELERELKKGNVRYHILNRRSKFGFYKFFRIVMLIRKERIKILHSHNLGSNFWGAVLGRICNVPVIIAHEHGSDYKNHKSIVLRSFINFFLSQIVFVSRYEKNRFLKTFDYPEEKSKIIYNGVSTEFLEKNSSEDFRKRFSIQPNERLVCIIARFSKEKNHETFLHAAKEVSNKVKNVKFLLVGEGARKNEMIELAENLGISDKIVFTGHIEALSEILSEIDLGCLSSLREGLGIALIEYMAFKKPIVATKVGGIPEVVHDTENGYLVPSGDHKKMADRIITILNDQALANEMGMKGYEIFKANFTENIMLDNIEKLYKSLYDSEQ